MNKDLDRRAKSCEFEQQEKARKLKIKRRHTKAKNEGKWSKAAHTGIKDSNIDAKQNNMSQ